MILLFLSLSLLLILDLAAVLEISDSFGVLMDPLSENSFNFERHMLLELLSLGYALLEGSPLCIVHVFLPLEVSTLRDPELNGVVAGCDRGQVLLHLLDDAALVEPSDNNGEEESDQNGRGHDNAHLLVLALL